MSRTLCFILMIFSLSSCTSVVKLLCKPWKIAEVNFNQQSGGLSKEQMRVIEFQLRNEFDFRFYPDSVYRVIRDGDTIYGKWYLSADKKTITSKVENNEEVSEIMKINKKEFWFNPTNDHGSINYIRCLPTTAKK